ncbi:hypothetical protein HNP84_008314 [Thermocatellispora tengchongensis]|uniref:DUF559 domain-containing protein n=1 Tax=Thermocatellispora tengchongensis TaxID=1073253 RepID=A0A840PLQ2_9ACTN|nr:DUF559 domain-containing protein [Thermocatellispora tengchongensis]MBB5138560.1 hypothetical protein [Thermocatellispora tengchongensis]
MGRSWAELPTGRVVRLRGASVDALVTAVDPLPSGAPAIVVYVVHVAPETPGAPETPAEIASAVLADLESAAIALYPAWLPGAEGIEGPGGAGVPAVRALAMRLAATTRHFGPFLADLAETALRGHAPQRPRAFAPEVRAAGLRRVIAAGYRRPGAALLVQVPPGLPARSESALLAACDWLCHRGGFAVWLTGTPLATASHTDGHTESRTHIDTHIDGHTGAHIDSVTVTLPEPATRLPRPARGAYFPALAGRPHPFSRIERHLERALSACDWAAGREWNQTHRFGPLHNPIRVDLLWRAERCVVEIDGDEHRRKAEADRQRDHDLEAEGYAVLRVTNAEVEHATEAVVQRIRRFVTDRRKERPCRNTASPSPSSPPCSS